MKITLPISFILIWALTSSCGSDLINRQSVDSQNASSSSEDLRLNHVDANVVIEAGTLSIGNYANVTEGEDLARNDVLDLGKDSYSASGSSVSITPSNEEDPAKPMTIAVKVPKDKASLFLEESYPTLVIIYKARVYKDGISFSGIVPRERITILDGFAVFRFSYFGTFQAALIRPEINTSNVAIRLDKESTRSEELTTSTNSNLDDSSIIDSLQIEQEKVATDVAQEVIAVSENLDTSEPSDDPINAGTSTSELDKIVAGAEKSILGD